MMRMTQIDPAKLDAVKTIVVHDNCADGTASAIILKDAFYGRAVDIRFVQYGTAAYENLTPEPGMLFCDFSPNADKAAAFVEAVAIILDHHRTSKGVVESFGENGVFGDEKDEPGVCGAVLAFRHVWVPRRAQLAIQKAWAAEFATLAGIRDTWQRSDPRWRDACVQSNVLHFMPNERWLSRSLTELAASWDREFKVIGEILYEKNERSIARTIKGGYRFTTAKGTRVIAFDGLSSSSDAAEVLGCEVDLVVGFMPTNEDGVPKYIYSTRSHTTYDCSRLAKSYGGGGHTKAAGFNVGINPETALNPYATLRALLEAHENVSG